MKTRGDRKDGSDTRVAAAAGDLPPAVEPRIRGPARNNTPMHVATRTGAYDIEADAAWIGSDLLVCIWGGDRPHIGSVAAAQPRPSLKDSEATSATASVLTYAGHKDDVAAKFAAEALAGALAANVVVTAGIHWDNLDDGCIETVIANIRSLVGQLIQALKR